MCYTNRPGVPFTKLFVTDLAIKHTLAYNSVLNYVLTLEHFNFSSNYDMKLFGGGGR